MKKKIGYAQTIEGIVAIFGYRQSVNPGRLMVVIADGSEMEVNAFCVVLG